MTQQTWVADLTVATPKWLPEELLVTLDEEGDQYDRYVTPRPDGPGVQVSVYVEATDPVDATNHASEEVGKWLVQHGVHGETIGLRVLTEEQREAEAEAPTMPSLVSSTGVAEILGVQRQRVHQLYKENSRFPAPLVKLATGPVWDERAIEWFGSVWERKPGRPAARAASRVKVGTKRAVVGLTSKRAAMVGWQASKVVTPNHHVVTNVSKADSKRTST